MSRPSKAHTGAAKHLLRYLAGSTYFSITYKQGGFKLAAFLDANRGTTQTTVNQQRFIVMLASGVRASSRCQQRKQSSWQQPIEMGHEGLIALSTMEPELVAAALTMKDAVFWKKMMDKRTSKDGFDSVPPYIDNTSALHVAGNYTYSPRTQPIALRSFFAQELVEDGTITVYYVKTRDQPTNIRTAHLNNQHHRELINKIRNFEPERHRRS